MIDPFLHFWAPLIILQHEPTADLFRCPQDGFICRPARQRTRGPLRPDQNTQAAPAASNRAAAQREYTSLAAPNALPAAPLLDTGIEPVDVLVGEVETVDIELG
jgi:hypothetical protein